MISWQVNWDMSSDSAKENASVVDSTVTEWKQDIGNSDDPGVDNVCSVVASSIMWTKELLFISCVLFVQQSS